ncbi:hypothetical protein N9M70_05495, partial [Luminiphilus sp.]|nr:hypothetical protein [Luminiphilus sp.]
TDLPLKTIVRMEKSSFYRRELSGELNLDVSPAISRKDAATNTRAVYKYFRSESPRRWLRSILLPH